MLNHLNQFFMSVPTLRTPLISGKYYHLYNRGNNKEKLFFYDGNYDFFMEKYRKYCSPYVETYCYCLLPNHFHFLIRIKDEEINPRIVSNQFRKLFITYARMINNQERRTGCLVSKNFRRIEINNERYLKNLVIYIHINPRKHGIVNDINSYKYSTYYRFYHQIVSTNESAEVIDWFGGYSEFFENHKTFKDDNEFKQLRLED